MVVNRSVLFIVAAVVLFLIAALITVGAIAGNGGAFIAFGLAAFAASFLP